MAWNLENSVALGREGTGFATILKQPSLKELTTSPYEALARKKAAAKPDMTLYKDLTNDPNLNGVYENDKPEFGKRLVDWKEKAGSLYAGRANGTIDEPTALKQYNDLQKEKIQLLSDIDDSKQDNVKINSLDQQIQAKEYEYTPEKLDEFQAYKQLPFSQRTQHNYVLSQGDKFDWNAWIGKNMGTPWGVATKGYRGGQGEGYREGESYFDEAQARKNFDSFATAQKDDAKMQRWYHKAADVAQEDFEKNTNLQKQYGGITKWDDLSNDSKVELTDKKAEDMAVNIAREKFKKSKTELQYAAREKSGTGGGGGIPLAGDATYEVVTSLNNDGTFNKTQVVNLNTVSSKTGADSMNPQNYFNDAKGQTMPGPVHPTGKIIKKQDGIWMLEVEALDKFTDPITKKTINIHDKFEIPYEQNKTILKKYGYKLIDEIKSPEERKKMYDASIPRSPLEYNKITIDPIERANYKKKYEKWKASGWKNKSTAQTKVKAEDAINNQVASLTNQENKVGTYNPLTGQITFA